MYRDIVINNKLCINIYILIFTNLHSTNFGLRFVRQKMIDIATVYKLQTQINPIFSIKNPIEGFENRFH
jgi:hypothetical protein